jgi:DNA-binding transcriptional ArsR family regulator
MKAREFKNIIYTEMAKITKALSDPKRLEIIDLLCQGAKNVETIAREIDLPFASASHHLQTLKEARLIKDTKKGRFIFYQANKSAEELYYNLSNVGKKYFSEIQCALNDFFAKDNRLEGVSFDDLLKKVKSGSIMVIDVRPLEEYNTAHFPGSISLPVKELETRIKELPRNIDVVAYCRGKYCVLSHSAIILLKRKGITASILTAGVNDWKNEGRRLEYTE